VGADGFDPGTGNAEVDHIVIGPEGDGDPGAGGSQPELFAPHGQVARGRYHPVELHRPPLIDHQGAWSVGVLPNRLVHLDWLH
jgi:hypothetical protein